MKTSTESITYVALAMICLDSFSLEDWNSGEKQDIPMVNAMNRWILSQVAGSGCMASNMPYVATKQASGMQTDTDALADARNTSSESNEIAARGIGHSGVCRRQTAKASVTQSTMHNLREVMP